ncbi:MAG TPA: AMP-binding protein [Bryobacteraceae bacterium]|jgi:acyl-CoA synthetase (AMP-forming)/AMP-acid ligase II|nr:AMP-binding protein [Bryobacteraceae bacterium]
MLYIHSMGRAVRYYPERPALSLDQSTLTFSQLHDRVRRIVAGLSSAGFKKGDRLGILLPNAPEYIELVYACSWLGVIVVPINIRLSIPEIDHVLTDCTARGIVRHSTLPQPKTPLSWDIVLDRGGLIGAALTGSDGPCPDPCYDPEAILALIYTSGTTGQPKGVKLTHSNILSDVNNFNYWMRYREGGVFLHAAPIFHIADFPAMFAAPMFGASQVTLARFQPETFCEIVAKERVNYTVLVPTMISFLAQYAESNPHDLASLEVLAYGGSPMAPQLIRKVRELLPNTQLVQVYGLSETGFLTGLQDGEHTADKLMSCGRPCPGIDVQIVDDAGNPVKTPNPGEVVARGANVMTGYWNNDKETAASFRNGLFRTGDIGYQDSNGYFFILDRSKDMIVTGGENVYSGEVEAVIFNHPAVRDVAIFGIPDTRWGELVTACVVLKAGTQLTADELIAYCRQFLANYKVPRRIDFSEADLPRSASGKVLKRVLRERFWVGAARSVGPG